MFTIFTKYDEIDGFKDGFVAPDVFVNIFYEDLAIRGSLDRIDFLFLSLKYRNPYPTSQQEKLNVYYDQFYKDYEDLEMNGLGGKIFGLQKEIADESANAAAAKSEQNKNPFRFVIPEKYIQFYNTIQQYVLKKGTGKKAELISHLVHTDSKRRNGFITKRDIQNAFYEAGIELSNKQVQQLTFPLH